MSRKGRVAKRDVLPDPVYNSKLYFLGGTDNHHGVGTLYILGVTEQELESGLGRYPDHLIGQAQDIPIRHHRYLYDINTLAFRSRASGCHHTACGL